MSMVSSVDSAYSSINRLIAAARGNRPAPVRLSNPVMTRAQRVDAQDVADIQARSSTQRVDATHSASVSGVIPAAAPVQLPANIHPASPIGGYAASMSYSTASRVDGKSVSESYEAPGSRINVTA